MIDKLYTTAEVAELLNMRPKTVRGWIRDGLLPAARFGSSYRVKHEDLQQFIAKKFNMVEGA